MFGKFKHQQERIKYKNMKKYFCICSGMTYGFDFYAKSKKEARTEALRILGKNRLPNGTQIWEA
jgi:hypothetical protein